jgi:hypothetical protein
MVVLFLVPFFLAYTSGNFWLKESTYREQPQVQYMYKVSVRIGFVHSGTRHKTHIHPFLLRIHVQLIQVLEGTDADGVPMDLFFSTIRKGRPLCLYP